MFENYKWSDKLPNENLSVYKPNLKLFFETMFERQKIWEKRFILNLPAPWTENEILANSKFTNVYRELDRNSQWQIKNIISDDSLSLTNLIWKILIFRMFNNPDTFEFAKNKYGWKNGIPDYNEYDEIEFQSMISEVRNAGLNPFTNAYLINSMAWKEVNRDTCYTRKVVPTFHKELKNIIKVCLTAKTPEEIISFFKTLPSVADFIAHEYYQDFTYIPKYSKYKFMKFDQNDFTNVGPGASVGIRLIFPNLRGRNQIDGIYMLRDMAELELSKIGNFPYLQYDKENRKYYTDSECNITLHQIEMWLCEFQKYWKMTIGEGKQRSKFIPKN